MHGRGCGLLCIVGFSRKQNPAKAGCVYPKPGRCNILVVRSPYRGDADPGVVSLSALLALLCSEANSFASLYVLYDSFAHYLIAK